MDQNNDQSEITYRNSNIRNRTVNTSGMSASNIFKRNRTPSIISIFSRMKNIDKSKDYKVSAIILIKLIKMIKSIT